MQTVDSGTINADSYNETFNAERVELRLEYLNFLLASAIPFWVFSILRAAAWREFPGIFHTLPVAACLGLGLVIAYSWSQRRSRAASWIFLLSLIAANTLEVWYFPAGPAPFLYAVIAVAGALLLSEVESIALDVLLLITLGLITWAVGPAARPDAALYAAFLTILTGFVSWLGTHQLYTVLRWEWHSTLQAMEETRKAQTHRAETMHLNKELDGAYNRLERMNQLLILARKEAEEARMLKVQFANAVSHELRSPLNMIIGFSDMMVNSPEVYGKQEWAPRLRSHIQQIYQSSQHLSQLVDDVLDLARIDAYRLALNKQRLPINDVINEAVDITHNLYEARNLYLRVEVSDTLPPLLYDRTRLRQVLLNLLTNALRFTRRGGVTIRAAISGMDAVISVVDTGVGISSEDLPKLFQEFTQLRGSIYRQGQGFGLGLAISKQLVELHGGTVRVESEPGVGSTFSFTLPLDPAFTAEIVRDTPQDKWFWNALEEQASERMPVVVCASDSPARRLLASHLTAFDTTWVEVDADIAHAVHATQPAAVVRVALAAEDVFDANQVHLLRGIPLINCILPGLMTKPWISTLNDYLVKPISRRKLLDALRRMGSDFKHILIIEDEAPMREFLSLCIGSAYPECELRMAGTGEQALVLARQMHPDLILLDFTLPDADGLELAPQLRELAGKDTIIVAVTARDYPHNEEAEESDAITCARHGHFSQRELERILNALLSAISPSSLAVRANTPHEDISAD